MYSSVNYKTKKTLKESVANGFKNTVFNPGIGGKPPLNGAVYLEGPWYPEPHKWYAKAILENGVIVLVK